jgi:hypothetical protein
MKEILIALAYTLLIFTNAFAQQIVKEAGFKITAPCILYSHDYFIKEVEKQGAKVIGAYICADDENDYYNSSLVNVVVYDMADMYYGLKPENYVINDNKFLNEYSESLEASGIGYKRIQYMGVNALEYTFNQMDMPTKAIVFWKNKKSYLIQIGSRSNFSAKFNTLKSSFALIH